MPTYEMFWDCQSCGTTKLLGKSHRHCPACGQVQDPAWRYFPAEHEKVAVEEHSFVGVDWSCERCDTPNSAAASCCVNCGDARDGVEKDVATRADATAGSQSGTRQTATPVVDLHEPLPDFGWSTGKKVAAAALALGVVFLVGFVLLLFFWTESTHADVTGHSWKRSVNIERLEATSGGSWCDSVPGDAYNRSASRRERSSRQIPDGESCSTVNSDNGDGTFSTSQQCVTTYRSEPIYDDWCDYTVDRWQVSSTAQSNGVSLSPAPSWPSVSVSNCSSRGCTRQGSRRGSYVVHLVDGDAEQQVCDLSQSKWGGMPVGSRWTVDKRVLLDNLVCSSLVKVIP